MAIPQLSRAALSTGISDEILTRCAISTTVYSEKLETKIKWWISCPEESLNLEAIPYRLVFGKKSSANLAHQLLFEDLQSLHSSHWGWNTGKTMSPCLNLSTFSPMLSTTLDYTNPMKKKKKFTQILEKEWNKWNWRSRLWKIHPTASCPKILGNLASGPWKILKILSGIEFWIIDYVLHMLY